MKFFVFWFVLVLVNAPGGKVALIDAFQMGERIINGYPNKAGEVPYIVALILRKSKLGVTFFQLCGGTIIDHEWILTAAHCVEDVQSVDIGYGAIRRQEPKFVLSVDKKHIYQHKRYNNYNAINDVALIRTPFVNFTNLVDKIDLPTELEYRNNSFAGSWAVASGWGRTSDFSGVSDWLLSADVKVIENDECSKFFRKIFIADSTLCVDTEANGKSICSGDSGGPLVLPKHATEDGKPRLIGVASFGGIFCTIGYPNGFARVTEFMDWITKLSGVAN